MVEPLINVPHITQNILVDRDNGVVLANQREPEHM